MAVVVAAAAVVVDMAAAVVEVGDIDPHYTAPNHSSHWM
jgi:hypothetical protein